MQDQFVAMPKNQRIFRVIDEDDYTMPGYVVSIFKTIFTLTYTKQNRMDQLGVKMELNSASMFNVNSDLQTGIQKVGFRFSPIFCPFG